MPGKTDYERGQEMMLGRQLDADLEEMMGISNDPTACAKYRADMAANDILKYSPMSVRSGGLQETLNSPIIPSDDCAYCDLKPALGEKFQRCSACKVVKYCCQDCQKKDWKFHKEGCALLRSNPKNL